MRKRAKGAAVVAAMGMAFAFTGLSAPAAGAYTNSNLRFSAWEPDTSNCPCSDSSGLDYTNFKYDEGGEALKLVVKNNGTAVAQVEFHPSDELLYIYDGKNDGDTIYVAAHWWENGIRKNAVYWVSGTSDVLDMNVVEMDEDDDLEEGKAVYFKLYDDRELSDELTEWYDYVAHA
ncbi:hypothetical protein [Streptomyces indicus]|uniref:Secreted protein n=1 Tax=Streptomyces indicus TaxID=417292 RepID=A0A1G8UUK5_9ACTN|nr:hypothetical protein [Streptomyces indicus]SDJ57542.1 hypothetical protein SAMN05421806_1011079 [Streptomyces indicus]